MFYLCIAWGQRVYNMWVFGKTLVLEQGWPNHRYLWVPGWGCPPIIILGSIRIHLHQKKTSCSDKYAQDVFFTGITKLAHCLSLLFFVRRTYQRPILLSSKLLRRMEVLLVVSTFARTQDQSGTSYCDQNFHDQRNLEIVSPCGVSNFVISGAVVIWEILLR